MWNWWWHQKNNWQSKIQDLVITQQTLLVFQDVFKTSWRRLQNAFKTYLQYVFVKRLQDVFKTSCNYVFKTSWKKKMLYWRRLQYVFTKANICWECILIKSWIKMKQIRGGCIYHYHLLIYFLKKSNYSDKAVSYWKYMTQKH